MNTAAQTITSTIAQLEVACYVGTTAAAEPLQKTVRIINGHRVEFRIHGAHRYAWVNDSDERISFDRLASVLT